MKKREYNQHLRELQSRLVHMQNDVIQRGLRVAVLFEGRDTAGKGGTIKRVREPLNPRQARVVALSKPTERELGEWYFQRYVKHLPTAGEIVLFDRSWYNRAGVEPVMGFCTPKQHKDFLAAVPSFEKMLVDDGIILLKYWFSVSAGEQEKRFQDRVADPTKRWKLSPIDLKAREMWNEYSAVKDEMFQKTSIAHAPWHVVPSDDKKTARLNCIAHMLDSIPHQPATAEITELPPRVSDPKTLKRTGSEQSLLVPLRYG